MKERPGVALIAAVMLLSLLALITAGGFAAAVSIRRDGRLAAAEAEVLADADAAMENVVSSWPIVATSLPQVGQTETQIVPGLNTGVPDTVSITRLPAEVYWVVATAAATFPERAYRRANLLLRAPALAAFPAAALTSAGDVGIGAGVTFDQDTTRQGGTPCGQSGPGLSLAPGATLFAEPGGSLASITFANAPAAGDTASYALLPQGWNSFAARAVVRYPGGAHVTLGPASILYGGGDLVIDGGSGRGLVLVEGHLTIDGPTTLNGLIVARGGITVSAATDVTGALMSMATGGGAVSLQSTAIHYSVCAISGAVRAATVPRPVKGRAWVEIF